MTPTERGERAKRLLEDELLSQVFSDLRERFITQLETVPMGDVDTQHEVALSLQILKKVRAQLQGYMNDAAIAEANAKNDKWVARMRQSIKRA